MNRRRFLSHSSRLLVAAGLAPRVFAESPMPEPNQRRPLSFSNDWIESLLITNFRDMAVEDAIVVNLSTTALRYQAGGDEATIPAWKSTMLRHCRIASGERAALLHIRQRTNLGGLALAWEWYGQRNPQFPRKTPLYISSQDEVGEVQLDPLSAFTHEASGSTSPRRYRLKLNLWYTPEETDCGIHTGHQFLEVHTQVLGTGRMQKFRENNAETLYEDVLMPPGFTHDPFFSVANDRSFKYPWHRYYADTDCIWMAVELHPV
ncbi:MAG TPA: hypothetical protein VEI26_02670 [Terriglobales bacterium]|nr:hypothetical protein [Terriglobales bacterium]